MGDQITFPNDQKRLKEPEASRAEKPDHSSLSYLGVAVDTIVKPFVADPETRAEVDRYGEAFLKSAGLFLGGRLGLAGTLTTYGLDQAKPGDTATNQVADFTLGGAKGLAMRGIFRGLGSAEMDFATKGVLLGTSSRVVDAGLTRENYFTQDGKFSLLAGMNRVKETAFNPAAISADIVTFGIAHGALRGTNWATGGALDRSPLLSTVLTGTTFGVSTGAYSEIQRQQASGTFDLSRIIQHGLIQGGLDSIAALPVGFQARAASLQLGDRQTNYSLMLGRATDGTGTRPSISDIRWAEGPEANRLWHQAAKQPGNDAYSLGTLIADLPAENRLNAFKTAVTEFPNQSLAVVVDSIPREHAGELVKAIVEAPKLSDGTKSDLLFQMRFEQYSPQEIAGLVSDSANHPAMLSAVRNWWQYQEHDVSRDLSHTLPPEALGRMIFPDAQHADVASHLAASNPDLLRAVAQRMDVLKEPAVDQLADVTRTWNGTHDFGATLEKALSGSRAADFGVESPTVLGDAIRVIASQVSPAERGSALQQLSRLTTQPYERQDEHTVRMAYKLASAIGEVDPKAFADGFIKPLQAANDAPGQTLEWRRFSGSRLAELQRQTGVQFDIPQLKGLEVQLSQTGSGDQTLTTLTSKLQSAVEQLEPTQAKLVAARVAENKALVETVTADPKFQSLTPDQQTDTILAAVLGRTVQTASVSDGAAKSALAAEAVLRSMGIPAERATRIGAIVNRGHELAYNPSEPASGKLGDPAYREDLAVHFRNPDTLRQAMIVNRALALKQYGEQSAATIDGELNRTTFLIEHEASGLNRNFVPILTTEWPQQFGVVEAPSNFVAQAHTSDGIENGGMFRVLPLMESPNYSISTTMVKPGFDKTFAEDAHLMGLFSAPGENTAQSYRGSLWSGDASSWRDHVSLARDWVTDQSAVEFAGEMNTELTKLGFGAGKQSENAALRDYQQRLARYSTLDQMRQGEAPNSPLLQAHQLIVDAYTKMGDGNPLPDYNEFKTINPRLTAVGVMRRGQTVSFEDATLAQRYGASRPAWLGQGAPDTVLIPKTVTDQAKARNLPIVILDP